MKNREAELEKRCAELVLRVGGKHRKMDVGPGAKGQLDQHVWLPNGTQFDVEFKIGRARPSKLQQEKITWLQQQQHCVYVIRTVEDFEWLLRDFRETFVRGIPNQLTIRR